MHLICGPEHSFDDIPQYRMQFRESRLRMFLKDYSIKNYPIDCVDLLKTIQSKKGFSLQVGFISKIKDEFDAVSRYVEVNDTFQIILNKNKIHYPFKTSRDRRLNFTIAHELGHILLDHLYIPDSLKSSTERCLEDYEADEFAGRLLMPKEILLNCNFISFSAVAQYFNVSVTALKTRLTNLKKLDLARSKKIDTCGICGNHCMAYSAKYCSICGTKLENNRDGIARISYLDGICLDRSGQALTCPFCGNDTDDFNDSCSNCSTILHNYCTQEINAQNAFCKNVNAGNARYCEMCGCKTYFFAKGFLKPWHEHNAYDFSKK
jgi:hypothetical protein